MRRQTLTRTDGTKLVYPHRWEQIVVVRPIAVQDKLFFKKTLKNQYRLRRKVFCFGGKDVIYNASTCTKQYLQD